MVTTSYNFDFTAHNTFAMKVKCNCFMEYTTPEDIPFVLSTIRKDVDMFHIGGGSNLLFTSDFPGVILHSAIKGIEVVDETPDSIILKVGAGETMDEFIKWCCDSGYWGLENLSGIPGEVGASAVQNVGAYGVEAGDKIVRVHAFDTDSHEFTTIEKADCLFGYRTSKFKLKDEKGRYIIHSVEYQLSKTSDPKIEYPALANRIKDLNIESLSPHVIRDEIIEIRNSKLPDPDKIPSAGSFFKNPVVTEEQYQNIAKIMGSTDFPHFKVDDGYKIPAAWLIDTCGWKGVKKGNAEVWKLQPLVIVNPTKSASPEEIISLENDIIRSIADKFGVVLSPEVEHIHP